jgi:hypothetical protein
MSYPIDVETLAVLAPAREIGARNPATATIAATKPFVN